MKNASWETSVIARSKVIRGPYQGQKPTSVTTLKKIQEKFKQNFEYFEIIMAPISTIFSNT